MIIVDVYLGSQIRIFSLPDPHQFKYCEKMVAKLSEIFLVVHPGSGS